MSGGLPSAIVTGSRLGSPPADAAANGLLFGSADGAKAPLRAAPLRKLYSSVDDTSRYSPCATWDTDRAKFWECY